MLNPNELPPPDGLAKIVMQTHRNERGDVVAVAFAREDTGLIIGAAAGQSARFGIGGGVQEWFFLDQHHAERFLKDCCREYLQRPDIDFLTQESGALIQTPMPAQRHRM